MLTQVLVLLALGLVVYVAYKWLNKKDQNEDGKVDAADVVEAVKTAAVEVKEAAFDVADVNKDGKVDLADVAAAVTKVKKGRKKKVK